MDFFRNWDYIPGYKSLLWPGKPGATRGHFFVHGYVNFSGHLFQGGFSLALLYYITERGNYGKRTISHHHPQRPRRRGFLLTQDDMRQLLKNFRREAQLSFEALGKLCDIDPEILQDYEEGIYNLRPEAYRLILHVYGLLFDDFKVKN